MSDEERSAFAKWLLAKDERFYVLFLVGAMIFFGILSMLTLLVVSGFIVAGMWLLFYYTVIKRE